MLMVKKLPGYVGATDNPWANIAAMKGKGVELNVTYNKKLNKDLNVSATANLAYGKNEVTNIGDNDYITWPQCRQVLMKWNDTW